MPVYFFTGKLGSGKTLMAVERVDEALRRDVRVASNIDFNLDGLISYGNKHSRIARVPDKPTSEDLTHLGLGYEGKYDEKKAGLLVLDELGTWLNSRSWNDKARRPFIDWCLHARKYRWDIIFIVQDVSMVDGQVRAALCEYLVKCRRTDRMKIPGTNLAPPKVHMAGVYYGDDTSSDKNRVETIMYRGVKLFEAYDTEQCFIDDYDCGSHSVLAPWYFPANKAIEHKDERKIGMKTYLTIAIIGMALYWAFGGMFKTFTGGFSMGTNAVAGNLPLAEPLAVDDAPIDTAKKFGFQLEEYTYRGYVEGPNGLVFLLEDMKIRRLIDMSPETFESFGMYVQAYDLNTLVLHDVDNNIVFIDGSVRVDSGRTGSKFGL